MAAEVRPAADRELLRLVDADLNTPPDAIIRVTLADLHRVYWAGQFSRNDEVAVLKCSLHAKCAANPANWDGDGLS